MMAPKPRVLVVDDEQVIRASFNRVLSENGYTVNDAPDGPSALERLGKESFDLAFVDMRMPGMDGMDVVRSIRSKQPKTQVVIITGYGTEAMAKEASDLGVSDFISKPLAPEDITGLAGRAWERGKRVQQQVVPQPESKVETPTQPRAEAVVQAPVARPVEERIPLGKGLAMLVGGALLGMAYVIFLPFIGFGMLAWVIGNGIYKGLKGARAK